MVPVESMCKSLDIKRHEIPDWNGCVECGELPRHIMNARNIALSGQHNPKQDIVAICAACWFGTKRNQVGFAGG